ncbi:hypothetical protein [Curtobacterium sp. MCSS17_015]|uniref:hypothetical protein n=1 Tax=Curtobacterium sp. MCSS17_015 TaxID=2175666 RepID=UPI0011B7E4BF|nr:hypothetical protein [Curtobacterium sp. MCSS17_015]WIB25842.1 hypothetical protein DEJ18_12400 [Curtobacterium sp. MCSS17_015]
MPRDRANLRIDIWGDQDWRELSLGAQWLYEYLLTSPKLLYVGVADWRPARISKLVAGVTAADVERFGAELEAARFVVTDVDSDEIQIRSFLRHDGILQNPNMWKSIGLDFTAVSSKTLMASVAHEVRRLRDENPDGFKRAKDEKGPPINPWQSPHLRTLLDSPSDTPIKTPYETPSTTGSDRGSPTTTATSTTTEASLPSGDGRIKETRLPKDWAPTASHIELAKSRNVNVVAEADNFRLHAETHDRHAARWNAAFTTWLKKAKPSAAASPAYDWMNP